MLAHAADGAAAGYAHFWEDPTFWVLVASVIFVALVWSKARSAIGSGLDARIARIKDEIDEAERLKTEAQEMLAEAKRKQGEAEQQIADIGKQAAEEAALLSERMTKSLDEMLERREQQARDRIAQAEEQARKDIQEAATEVAVSAARKVIRESLGAEQSVQLVDAAIKELPEKLH